MAPVELDVERIPSEPSLRQPLGRHKVHDPRSRAYRVEQPRRAELRPVFWQSRTRPLDQGGPLAYRRKRYGGLGACTGMATAKALSCDSVGDDGTIRRGRRLLEPTALRLYSMATARDPWDGAWPDDDTGSSGLAVAKAAAELGMIVRYEHAFDVADVLLALQRGPIITGTLWLSGMDEPDGDGRVRPSGVERGGHEWAINGYDGVDLLAVQSWGGAWGKGGAFRIAVDDYAGLLARGGDATRLVVP